MPAAERFAHVTPATRVRESPQPPNQQTGTPHKPASGGHRHRPYDTDTASGGRGSALDPGDSGMPDRSEGFPSHPGGNQTAPAWSRSFP
jgi:hypothetical protein